MPTNAPVTGGGNLPLLSVPLFGRADDVVRVHEACERARLVTLTGAGGSGKTALAEAVAPDVADRHDATGWWIDLQPVRDDQRVAPSIADVLGVAVTGRGSTAATHLATTIGERTLLLVVDNCEQVLAGVVEVLDLLLDRCPAIRVLATSSEALGLPGEQVVQVGPLSVPALHDKPPSVEALEDHAASAMFLDRAGLHATSLSPEDRAAVARVCARLDGIPLALELAAARSPVLSPTQLDTALDDRFRLLRSSPDRTAADRQQTLEASIAWSHDLLDEAAQQMLRQLSVFPATFDLAAAAAVGSGGDQVAAVHLLQALAAKSLLSIRDRPSGRRYRLLESIRDFGRTRCEERGEDADAREAHLEATRSRLRRLGADQFHEHLLLRAEPWIEEELEDVRAAAAWAAATDRPGLVVDLWWPLHLWLGIHYRPLEAHAAAVTTMAADLDHDRLARALTMRSMGAVPADAAAEVEHGERAVSMLWPGNGAVPTQPLTAFCALLWGTAARTWAFPDDHEGIRDAARRLIEMADDNRGTWGEVPIIATAAATSRTLDFVDHPDESYAIASEGAAVAERVDAPFPMAICHMRAAAAAVAAGMPAATCTQHLEEAMAAVPRGWDHITAWIAATSGWAVAWATGDLEAHQQRIADHAASAGAADSTTAIAMRAARASLAGDLGRHHEAVAMAREALDRLDEAGGGFLEFLLRSTLIREHAALGDLQEAARLAALSTAAITAGTFVGLVQADRISVARLELASDRPSAALDLLADVARLSVERNYTAYLAGVAAHAAASLSRLGRHEDAARTLGVLANETSARGQRVWPTWQSLADDAEATSRDAIGGACFDEVAAAGQALAWPDWGTWLSRRRGRSPGDRPVTGWDALTPTEEEVALHATEGGTTAQIAEAMFVSPNTVKTHLKHIYRKLDVHSRVELANVASDHAHDG